MILLRNSWPCFGLQVLLFLLLCDLTAAVAQQATWPMAGQNIRNTRSQDDERVINASNVKHLRLKWTLELPGAIQVEPVAEPNFIYIGMQGGFIYKVDTRTQSIEWLLHASEYTGNMNERISTSPLITSDSLVFSTGGAILISVDKKNRNLRWKIDNLSEHPNAKLTQSAVAFGDAIYVGLSSGEENRARELNYKCCSFRGSVVKIDQATGKIKWQQYMAPSGYSGNAVWGDTLVVDPARNSVYATTGNNYMAPESTLVPCGKQS